MYAKLWVVHDESSENPNKNPPIRLLSKRMAIFAQSFRFYL